MSNFCPNCQVELVEKKGVSKKTGKPYHFFSCPNYPACDYTKQADEWKKVPPPNDEVMDALRKIYAKLEEMHTDFKAFTEIFSKKE